MCDHDYELITDKNNPLWKNLKRLVAKCKKCGDEIKVKEGELVNGKYNKK